MFQAGNTDNVIPQTAQLRGTARSLTPEVRDLLEKRLHEIVEGTAAALRRQGHGDIPARLSGAGEPRARRPISRRRSPARSPARDKVDTDWRR